MKNLFLLFVVVTGLAFLHKVNNSGRVKSPSHVLKRIYVKQALKVVSNGNVFLPRTIRFTESKVKPKMLKLSIAGKFYTYEELFADSVYWLEPSQEVREVPVVKNDLITVVGMDELSIFFAREL